MNGFIPCSWHISQSLRKRRRGLTYSLCKLALYLSTEVTHTQKLIAAKIIKLLYTKAMCTLIKFPGTQTKEAEDKTRNLSTCIFRRSFIVFTATSRSKELITVHWLRNAKQRFGMKSNSFKATFLKTAHDVIHPVCFKWGISDAASWVQHTWNSLLNPDVDPFFW